MVKLHIVAGGGGLPPIDNENEWLRFLEAEGLEALAAFRSIRDPSARAEFVKQMKEAAAKEREDPPT